jgi:HlyD family secretion protein
MKPSTGLVLASSKDAAVVPALLEFQSPSMAIIEAPIPRSARGMIWMVAAMFGLVMVTMSVFQLDQVVTASGKVVPQNGTILVQPLEASIVRSIDVKEGQVVRAGDILARLDPTFTAADMASLAAQVSSYQAEVAREQAEVDGKPFTYSGTDYNLALQAAIFANRASERKYKLENYQQKIDSLLATVEKSKADAVSYQQRLAVADQVLQMRTTLERDQVGSKLNTLAARDNRVEMERGLNSAVNTGNAAARDLTALIAERDGYVNSLRSDAAEKLAESTRKLSDAREQLTKAQLRRQLVEMRADTDATVMSIAAVSVGSVLQPADQFITLVPLNAPLEVSAEISGVDSGFVHVGDNVAIKFDTFQYSQYGMAEGEVLSISPNSVSGQEGNTRANRQAGTGSATPSQVTPYYIAKISLPPDKIKLYGIAANYKIVPGMPIVADIKVGKRSVMAYLLSRVIPVAHDAMREP